MKIVPDTNVLIGFFRNPESRAEFDARMRRPLLYMSSVVAMELRAGCRDARHTRALTGFLRPFTTAGRIVAPDHAAFLEAGKVIAQLAAQGLPKPQLRAMTNDVLIAISASRAGAVVLTNNAADFSRIEAISPIRWISPV